MTCTLRIHVAQIAYNYSAPGMEDALYEIAVLRQFCRVELTHIPDESSILRFRHLLEANQLAGELFGLIKQQLDA
ncbi:transposase [Chitinivorax sp. B]|uniref:transposase n=1 Tax=Chitinivorax sp. B TaxID=2502235 RepID=UPI0010FA47E2|nr:transposase [Chitinivorax sp. B]